MRAGEQNKIVCKQELNDLAEHDTLVLAAIVDPIHMEAKTHPFPETNQQP